MNDTTKAWHLRRNAAAMHMDSGSVQPFCPDPRPDFPLYMSSLINQVGLGLVQKPLTFPPTLDQGAQLCQMQG